MGREGPEYVPPGKAYTVVIPEVVTKTGAVATSSTIWVTVEYEYDTCKVRDVTGNCVSKEVETVVTPSTTKVDSNVTIGVITCSIVEVTASHGGAMVTNFVVTCRDVVAGKVTVLVVLVVVAPGAVET